MANAVVNGILVSPVRALGQVWEVRMVWTQARIKHRYFDSLALPKSEREMGCREVGDYEEECP